jgi:hypothetical protein
MDRTGNVPATRWYGRDPGKNLVLDGRPRWWMVGLASAQQSAQRMFVVG